ncbi:hypothetical protein [Paludibacterium yongneupense]|uniref:hypothetical protein n=1 Tax=Paludibacterium yongneupense TaxID=400061 RepID=UPI00146EED4B|nr:hypothetical protein [Paludibacterium yongneupense]
MFRAKADASSERLQAAALAITPILAGLPGFISREFGASGDGQFIDIVHWRDLFSARQAAEKVMGIPACREFFALIEESQTQLMHFNKIG